MSTFTLRLLSLRCIQAQEGDGDEIYLKLNGEIIFSWDKIGRKFTNLIRSNKQTASFDFRKCRFSTGSGDQETDAYTPDQFEFVNQTDPMHFELWESDANEFLLGGDDNLGQLVVSAQDIKPGEIAHGFMLSGAEYEFRYTLTGN